MRCRRLYRLAREVVEIVLISLGAIGFVAAMPLLTYHAWKNIDFLACTSDPSKFQSIFQLGAAVCLAFAAGGLQIRSGIAYSLGGIERIRKAMDAMKQSNVRLRNQVLRDETLQQCEEFIQKIDRLLVLYSRGDLPFFLSLAVANIAFLVYSSFASGEVYNGILIPLSVFSLFPIVAVPLRTYRKSHMHMRLIEHALHHVNAVDTSRRALIEVKVAIAQRNLAVEREFPRERALRFSGIWYS